jgi:CarboxypepD_reg-like domain
MNRPILRLAFYSLIVLAGTITAKAQDKFFHVRGIVTDEKSGQPLAGASVFCQNTTTGAVCANDGSFFLRLADGGYDMVVSYTGYETKLIRIGNTDKGLDSMSITLKEEDKTMTEVVVTGSAEVKDGWAKYGHFFLDNFIGTTPNAAQCTLENKEALRFFFYKTKNKLRVKAKENLVITNNALGYKIKYQLDSFVYEYSTNTGSFTGYPLFEELPGTAQQQEDWKQRRAYTYAGSRLHFMRCWYDSTLTENGYVLESVDSTDADKFTTIDDPYNSRLYSVDSGDVNIDMSGRLRVSYTGHLPDRRYLDEHKFPHDTRAQISAIDIVNGFVIRENGYFYEQSEVTNSGYWAWKKLAEVLPYDYDPPADLIP